MTRQQNQGRRWRVCLFVTAAASVKSQLYGDLYHGVSGEQLRAPVSLWCSRGGSLSPVPREQPPPPPPPRPPTPQALEKKDIQQQQQGRPWSGRRIVPPPPPRPQQPSGEQSSEERPAQRPPPPLSHAPPQRPDYSLTRAFVSPKLASPPSSHLASESRHAAAWRPSPPPQSQNHVHHHLSKKEPPATPPVSRKVNTRLPVQSTIKNIPEEPATVQDTVFVPRRPGESSESVGDARNSPFVPLPDDGNASVGDTRNTPFVLRPNSGSESVGETRSSPFSMDSNPSDKHLDTDHRTSPFSMGSNPSYKHLDTDHQSSPFCMDSNPSDKHLDTDIRTVPLRHGFKALGTADFILVSPENVDQLDRTSLKTGIRPREARRRSTFGSLVHVRHELVLEQLLQSQESIREEMVAITHLLRALLAVQVRHDSLVLHVPRQLAHVAYPRISTRRRVEKRRIIPRKTILSTLENLDRDLSDGEFNVLLDGLMQPSEVEEVYHEYEYDQDDFLQQEVHRPIHVTSNQEEFNEFLRASSESETAEQYYEQDQYDSNISYDYYDDEPLDELWDEASLTDTAVGELTKDEILHADKGDVEMSVTDPEDGFSFGLASSKEKHVLNDDASEKVPETSSRRNENSAANGPRDSITRVSTSAPRRPPPPPPPPRDHSTKGQSFWRNDENGRRPPTDARVRTANEALKKRPPPPPPPPRVPPHPDRMTPLPPLSKLSPEVVYEHEESEWSDQSDDLDPDELRLLEDTAINEIDDRVRDKDEEFEDYEDSIDEVDLRILQLSRWKPSHGRKRSRWMMPFVGRKKQIVDDEEKEDLLVDEAVYLDKALFDAMSTDDFTDIEEDAPSLAASLIEDEESSEESSEDEMILGESAVTDLPGYTESHFGGPKLNSNAPLAQHGNDHFRLVPPPPPPPRPPPRQVSEHYATKMHSVMQRPHVQQAVQPQLASATGQSTHYQVYPPYSSQQHELHDRRTSRAPASHSPHGTGYPNTHTNPPSHNSRDTRHPNADEEKSPYKR